MSQESNANPQLTKEVLWHEITQNYYSVLEVKKKIEPWDIHVRISLSSDISPVGEEAEGVSEGIGKRGAKKGMPISQFIVDMTNFFARYPELDFTNVVFLEPTRRVEAGDKAPLLEDLLAVFGEVKYKTQMEIIRHKKTNIVQVTKSRAHALQLFYMFRVTPPQKRGSVAELFIKLTPMLPGSERSSKRAQKMTLLTPISAEKEKGSIKIPRIPVKRAAGKGKSGKKS